MSSIDAITHHAGMTSGGSTAGNSDIARLDMFSALDVQPKPGCKNSGKRSATNTGRNMSKGGLAKKATMPVDRKMLTVAQIVKSVISDARWSADAIYALLDKPRVLTLSPWDHRREPEEIDLAWAAGFFDGEGCIHIARQTYRDSGRRPTFRLRVNISQVNKKSLQEFEWAVGLCGNLASPKPKGKQNRTCHSLNYDGLGAFVVLQRLRTMLRRKREQCEMAFEFQDHGEIHTHFGPKGCPETIWDVREAFFRRMSTAKRDN